MNFALILLILTVFTGVFWALDRWKLRPERMRAADEAVREFDEANAEAIERAEPAVIAERGAIYAEKTREPWWVDYTAGLFPVILAVFLVRSFVIEPFRIPSGSMLPTLYVGDFILVNKYSYGVRLPVANTKVIPVGEPARGDVVVFRYPVDTSVDYIKRVVGVPGDTIRYINKKLTVNGEECPQEETGDWIDPNSLVTLSRREESLTGVGHEIVIDGRAGPGLRGRPSLAARNACTYNSYGFECTVPEGHYFMMGDNRDNSDDSRYWGLVPEENLVGKAFLIWANFGDMTRVGSFR